jgi:hypothetical protein
MLHNFGTPKQCIQARNTSFASFYLSKVCEMLRNTPKHHFGSNGVEWMLHHFDTPKQCIHARNTSFASLYLSKVIEMLRNTPKQHLAQMEWNGCFTTLTPRNSVFKPETQVLHLCTCRRLSKCSETLPNIILAQMEWNGCFTTSIPRNSVFRLGTQVLHPVTC